jgi:hypothetical protein
MIAAITITISKFGPSGSLRSENNALEHAIAVRARITSEVFFEGKCISVIILTHFTLWGTDHCCQTWIRTKMSGFRVRYPTIR